MITVEHVYKYTNYRSSFADFARDFFGVETTHNMDTREVDFVGPEELILALIVWNALFKFTSTYMVAAHNQIVADHWRHLLIDAVAALPEYLKRNIRTSRDLVEFDNGNRVIFRVCSENAGKGMTLSSLYVVEPSRIKDGIYNEFMAGILPVILSGRSNRQIIRYSRGY